MKRLLLLMTWTVLSLVVQSCSSQDLDPDGDLMQNLKKLSEYGHHRRSAALNQNSLKEFPTMTPDGNYVGNYPQLAPDGHWVPGKPHITPEGHWVGGIPHMAPDGTWVGGTPHLAPDGHWVGGHPILAPNGYYIGDGQETEERK